MAIATPERYAEMLDAAHAGGYAYPAINVTSSQTLNAALTGFADARSDGIVQITVGGARHLGGGDALAGARALAAMAHELAGRVPVTVALHTDHCPPEHVEDFLRPLIAGRRFNSHMFDGSSLPLAENLAIARELLARCAEAGLMLELEVGVVGGEEDGIRGDGGRLYTTTEDLLAVAGALGTGERGRYLLAATFGNVHGLTAPERVRLRPEILRDGQLALAGRGRFDYVFHGSSGTAADVLRRTLGYGVVKVNLDSEAQLAFTRGAAEHLAREFDGTTARKAAYDPRAWGAAAQASMAARVAQACRDLGCAGNALDRP